MSKQTLHKPSGLKTKKRVVIAFSLSCWGVVLIAGTFALANYSSAPGNRLESRPTSEKYEAQERISLDKWPTSSVISAVLERPTLLIFLHPRCPCSRASLRELASVLSNSEISPRVIALFYCPKGEPDSWAHTDLWSSMEKVSDCTLYVDRDGEEAFKFGAMTSGHLMFYATNGSRSFSGGITCGRGHEGESPAKQALTNILNGHKTPQIDFPVFGCAIISRPTTREAS